MLAAMSYGTPPFYFGHRPPALARSESPFKLFIVRCGKCQGEQLRIVSEQDESGEFAIYLICSCGQRERLPVS
jgi:hypothetical protein